MDPKNDNPTLKPDAPLSPTTGPKTEAAKQNNSVDNNVDKSTPPPNPNLQGSIDPLIAANKEDVSATLAAKTEIETRKTPAKPIASSAARAEKGKGGKDGKLNTQEELRPKDEQVQPGRFESIGPQPTNNIEALKAQGKQFGGAEGEKQNQVKSAATETKTDKNQIK